MAAADTTPGACARGCLTCSTPLPEQRGRGRPRLYCNSQCRAIKMAPEPRACRTCGVLIGPSGRGKPRTVCRACRPKGVPRYVKLPLPDSATCRHCANDFSPTSRLSAYCSPDCKRLSLLARTRGKRVYGPRLRTGHCNGCSSRFESMTKSHGDEAFRYCSRECHHGALVRVANERAALRRMAKAWAPKPNPIVVAEVQALRRIARRKWRPRLHRLQCRDCQCLVIASDRRVKLCRDCVIAIRRANNKANKGSACQKRSKRIYKARRRALERGAKADRIDPIAVFRRDKWRCKLCGVKTPQELRGTYEPNAPELDHVQSLADGGEHIWANVQCACRQCNIEKGAKSLGQFHLPFAA
jgi:hypothetical protein